MRSVTRPINAIVASAAVLTLTAFPAAGPANAAPPEAVPASVQSKGCTFYDEPDGGGGGWHTAVAIMMDSKPTQDTYTRTVKTLKPAWNQRISSIQCDDSDAVHCSVAVYREADKRGDNAIFWGSQGLFNLSSFNWDNAIASYQIFCNAMK